MLFGKVFILVQHLLLKLEIRIATQHNVCPPTGHVRRDSHDSLSSGLGNNLRLLFVKLGVEDMMGDATVLEHCEQALRLFDGNSSDQDGLALFMTFLDFLNNCLKLLFFRPVDHIREILTNHGLVGRNHIDIKIINLREFGGFRISGSGHPG